MLKALVVDDDPVIQNILTALLQEKNIAVLQATTGKESLELIAMTRPDCIFLDIFLSDISGIEIARKMLAEFSKPNDEGVNLLPPPIVYVSANTVEEVREIDPDLPIDHYLRKPFNSTQLGEILKSIFPNKELG